MMSATYSYIWPIRHKLPLSGVWIMRVCATHLSCCTQGFACKTISISNQNSSDNMSRIRLTTRQKESPMPWQKERVDSYTQKAKSCHDHIVMAAEPWQVACNSFHTFVWTASIPQGGNKMRRDQDRDLNHKESFYANKWHNVSQTIVLIGIYGSWWGRDNSLTRLYCGQLCFCSFCVSGCFLNKHH